MTQEERQDKFSDFFGKLWRNGTEFDNSVNDYCNLEDLEDLNYNYGQLYDFLQDKGFFDLEVIYYSCAIKYLSENDSSLNESLGLAGEMCCELENINSELLASLLASQNFREYFAENEDNIQEFLNDLEEDNELEGGE